MKQPQVSATIPQDIYKIIEEMAQKQDRTVSSMVSVLLQAAIREKLRKRSSKDNIVS
jgi:hypothetical protein